MPRKDMPGGQVITKEMIDADNNSMAKESLAAKQIREYESFQAVSRSEEKKRREAALNKAARFSVLQNRNIALRFTPAKLGGGVEGDPVAEEIGNKFIASICRWWNSGTRILNIVRKINGSLDSSNALSMIDIYAILHRSLKAGHVKDRQASKTNDSDMTIAQFGEVFKCWQSGQDRSDLYEFFPHISKGNIDRFMRTCERRAEAEIQQEQEVLLSKVAGSHVGRNVKKDAAITSARTNEEARELMMRFKALALSEDLIKRLHDDDASAVRHGEFMIVNNRPAFVLFLAESQDAMDAVPADLQGYYGDKLGNIKHIDEPVELPTPAMKYTDPFEITDESTEETTALTAALAAKECIDELAEEGIEVEFTSDPTNTRLSVSRDPTHAHELMHANKEGHKDYIPPADPNIMMESEYQAEALVEELKDKEIARQQEKPKQYKKPEVSQVPSTKKNSLTEQARKIGDIIK